MYTSDEGKPLSNLTWHLCFDGVPQPPPPVDAKISCQAVFRIEKTPETSGIYIWYISKTLEHSRIFTMSNGNFWDVFLHPLKWLKKTSTDLHPKRGRCVETWQVRSWTWPCKVLQLVPSSTSRTAFARRHGPEFPSLRKPTNRQKPRQFCRLSERSWGQQISST